MATVVNLAVMVLDQEGRGRGRGAREGGVERMRRLLSGGHDLPDSGRGNCHRSVIIVLRGCQEGGQGQKMWIRSEEQIPLR